MHLKRAGFTSIAMAFAFAAMAGAQKTESIGTGSGGSPHEKTTWTIGGATISIQYGRPYLKGRPEAQLMPPGQPWRTGADQATVLTTDKTLTFGKVALAPGSYTINTEPGAHEWTLILGKLGTADQWGIPYLPKLEIGRAPMKVSKESKSAEQVTISIRGTGTTATLAVEWGTVSAATPFHIGS
ncbi:MAG: DUF2911 domain-containing protein [Gemmatimonadaceae bacterium]